MAERGSQAIHRVLDVLMCWNDDSPMLTLSQVAERTSLTLPTAHRMVKALQSAEFLVKDRSTGSYGLGPKIMDLARVVLQRADQDELVVAAMPHMERMRATTQETIGLHIAMGDRRMCVAELVSRQPIRAATGVGQVYKLPSGAAGRVLVAWSEDRLEMMADAKSAKADLRSSEAVRKQGYAMSEGETIPGASAIAFPVFGSFGEVQACVNITGPSDRWTRSKMVELLPSLKDEMKHLNQQLGSTQGG